MVSLFEGNTADNNEFNIVPVVSSPCVFSNVDHNLYSMVLTRRRESVTTMKRFVRPRSATVG